MSLNNEVTEKMQLQISKLQKELSSKENNIFNLTKEFKELQEDHQNQNKENKNLQKLNQQLSQRSYELKNQHQQIKFEYEPLKEEQQQLLQQNFQLKEELLLRENECSTLKKDNFTLKNSYNELHQKYLAQINEIQKIQNDIKKFSRTNIELTNQLQQQMSRDNENKFGRQYQNQQETIQQLKFQIVQLEEDIALREENISALTNENIKLKEKLSMQDPQSQNLDFQQKEFTQSRYVSTQLFQPPPDKYQRRFQGFDDEFDFENSTKSNYDEFPPLTLQQKMKNLKDEFHKHLELHLDTFQTQPSQNQQIQTTYQLNKEKSSKCPSECPSFRSDSRYVSDHHKKQHRTKTISKMPASFSSISNEDMYYRLYELQDTIFRLEKENKFLTNVLVSLNITHNHFKQDTHFSFVDEENQKLKNEIQCLKLELYSTKQDISSSQTKGSRKADSVMSKHSSYESNIPRKSLTIIEQNDLLQKKVSFLEKENKQMCAIRSQNLRLIVSINKYESLEKYSKSSSKVTNQDLYYFPSKSLTGQHETLFYPLDSSNKGFKCQSMFEQINSKLQKDSDIKALLTVFYK